MRGLRLIGSVVLLAGTSIGRQSPRTPPAIPPAQATVQAILTQYCVTCHNQKMRTANLELDTKRLDRLADDVVAWEAVVRKLRTGMMPPNNAPRPDRAALDTVATWLETGLDRAAVERPRPGSPSLHRLNRNEYANAIRDLLDLKVDVSAMLPSDSTSAGFDNIADVLGTSPALIQGYVSAAMKVSRLAVGDLTAPPAPVTYRAPRGLSQGAHLDGLPLGTQGGFVVQHNFPLNAVYEIAAGGARVDLTLDGMSVPVNARGSVRLPVPAGPHTIAASGVRAFEAGNLDDIFSAPQRGAPGVTTITVTGPFEPGGPGDTPSRRRIFACRPVSAADETRCAQLILRNLASRAFRQPVKNDDPAMEILLGFYQEGRNAAGFDAGVQRALARILVDPRFIFRMEQIPANVPVGSAYRLSDLELASRLSFFLWSSIPDDALLERAAAGQLSDPSVLEAQVRRMLADVKSRAVVDNFASEWMRLRELDNAEPESPDFDGNLRLAFKREMEMFFDYILRGDRSLLDVLDAGYTFVDERLAKHYGIPGIKGSLFRRVSLAAADHPRRGVLGKGSILLVTSAANRTSPVQRGQWVLENLLGSKAPSPPPGVETNLDQKTDIRQPQTLRERMEQHRTNPVCSSCHSIMDPIGFSLENFDLTGRWRDREGASPIDAKAEMVDGSPLNGPASLRGVLMARREAFVTVAAEKLLTYATGRSLTAYDMPAVRAIVRNAAANDYRFSALVLGVVRSEPFRMRTREKA